MKIRFATGRFKLGDQHQFLRTSYWTRESLPVCSSSSGHQKNPNFFVQSEIVEDVLPPRQCSISIDAHEGDFVSHKMPLNEIQ